MANVSLTQKEASLLKDLRDEEQLCIDKYTKHSSCASDPQLKNLFTQLAQCERKHFDLLGRIGSGEIPQMPPEQAQKPTFTAVYGAADTPEKQNDGFLCRDLLSGEKHVSHLYDTCVFEFTDDGVRKLLGQIEAEEQEHGKRLYDYMKVNSMYA